MKKYHIINAGKLLLQYKLLKCGIESIQKTNGNDAIIEISLRNKVYNIQVKTTEKPRPGGGKGKDAISWNIRNISADFIACVNLLGDEAWLFTPKELIKLAQHPSKDKLYIYTNETVKTRKRSLKTEFKEYLIDNRINSNFT